MKFLSFIQRVHYHFILCVIYEQIDQFLNASLSLYLFTLYHFIALSHYHFTLFTVDKAHRLTLSFYRFITLSFYHFIVSQTGLFKMSPQKVSMRNYYRVALDSVVPNDGWYQIAIAENHIPASVRTAIYKLVAERGYTCQTTFSGGAILVRMDDIPTGSGPAPLVERAAASDGVDHD